MNNPTEEKEEDPVIPPRPLKMPKPPIMEDDSEDGVEPPQRGQ